MKQVTSILIGAGLRGGYVYSQYALDHPDEFKVVAVAEPDQERRELFAAKHNIPKELQVSVSGEASRSVYRFCISIHYGDNAPYYHNRNSYHACDKSLPNCILAGVKLLLLCEYVHWF